MEEIKEFHEYSKFFNWLNHYDGELVITMGGEVYCGRNLVGMFKFIKK